MEKPKRPLSSYNLFYRFKRAKILEAHANGGDESTDTIHKLIMTVPGLEDYPAIDGETLLSSPELKEHRRNVIRSALLDNLVPTETKRSHRKSHGAMNFLEMNKIMCASWKSIDEYSLSVFEELAEEGRGIYKERVAVYNELSPLSQKKVIKSVDMPPMTGGVMGMLRVETPSTSVPQDVASFHMKNEVVSSHQVMNGRMTGTTADVQPSAFTTGKMTTRTRMNGADSSTLGTIPLSTLSRNLWPTLAFNSTTTPRGTAVPISHCRPLSRSKAIPRLNLIASPIATWWTNWIGPALLSWGSWPIFSWRPVRSAPNMWKQ